MLRVGLTGDLGSGKSTVARMLAERGALVLSSDEMGRELMQPGQAVYGQILAHFGPSILARDGTLDRAKLASLAFDDRNPRVEELNAIVHPAVIEAQSHQLAELAKTNPDAIAVVESALIFSTIYAGEGTWRSRFDRILLVTAPEEQKILRFIERAGTHHALTSQEREALAVAARQRLSFQRSSERAADCIVLQNDGDIELLEARVEDVWHELALHRRRLQ